MRAFIFLLLPSLLFAETKLGSPGMLKKMLKVNRTAAPHKCHDTDLSASKGKKVTSSRRSIDLKLTCQFSCKKGEALKVKTIESIFKPQELSLSAGDGSSREQTMWRSLGVTLEIWQKNSCYELAENLCSKEPYTFRAVSMKSGNWKFKGSLNCKDKKVVYSPFDSKFKIKQAIEENFNLAPSFPFDLPNSKATSNDLSELLDESIKREKIFENSKCKKAVTLNTCFGDCVWDNGSDKWPEILSSEKPYASDTFKICIDSVYDEIASYKNRKTRIFKCEKFIWEANRKFEQTGASCAAFRYDHNCESIF